MSKTKDTIWWAVKLEGKMTGSLYVTKRSAEYSWFNCALDYDVVKVKLVEIPDRRRTKR